MNTLFAFVMIVISSNGGNSIDTHHVPFATLDACEKAAEAISTNSRHYIIAYCHATGA